MISSRRRILLVLVSVSSGSLISLWILKKRLGTLHQSDYLSLLFNFIFAAAVVIGLAIFFQRMNDQEKKREESGKKDN